MSLSDHQYSGALNPAVMWITVLAGNCEGLAPHDLSVDAACEDGLEQLAQKIVLAKRAVAVLARR